MRTSTKLKVMFSVLAGLLLGMCAVTNAKAVEPGDYIMAADACYEAEYIEDLAIEWENNGTEAASDLFWSYVEEDKCIDLSDMPAGSTLLQATQPAYEIEVEGIGKHMIWEALTRWGEKVYVLMAKEEVVS